MRRFIKDRAIELGADDLTANEIAENIAGKKAVSDEIVNSDTAQRIILELQEKENKQADWVKRVNSVLQAVRKNAEQRDNVFENSDYVKQKTRQSINETEFINGLWDGAENTTKSNDEKSQLETFDNINKNIYNRNTNNWYDNTYQLKYHYDKSIANGDLSPLVDFNLYKHYHKILNINLNGIKTVNDIEVKGHRFHFIDRMFGSVEQKRSGVEIQEIKNTLLNKSAKIKEKENSIKIYGENCVVSINQHTGQLVQVNPY